ncbi:hypothetical protein [Bradyrhizobium japonicum]|nr:hypothetical protein [Bradyrhizobium japonicum]
MIQSKHLAAIAAGLQLFSFIQANMALAAAIVAFAGALMALSEIGEA